jgi:hypothetical protein
MDKKTEQKLKKCGWKVECESPLEIRFEDDGAFATGLAAQLVIESLDAAFPDELSLPVPMDATVGEKWEAPEFSVAVTVEKVRQLGTSILKTTEFTTAHAEAVLLVFGGTLHDRLNDTVKAFITEKLA